MVSLLSLGLVLQFNVLDGTKSRLVGALAALLCLGVIGTALWWSRKESPEIEAQVGPGGVQPPAGKIPDVDGHLTVQGK